MVSGNAAATAQNILASERLFRLGILSELICAVEFIFLLWVLYRLLGGVNKTYASLMVILGLGFVPIMCVNVLNEIAALTLLRGADFLSVLGQGHAVPRFASLRVRYRLDLWPLAFLLWAACI
jgi:hypothetical protein